MKPVFFTSVPALTHLRSAETGFNAPQCIEILPLRRFVEYLPFGGKGNLPVCAVRENGFQWNSGDPLTLDGICRLHKALHPSHIRIDVRLAFKAPIIHVADLAEDCSFSRPDHAFRSTKPRPKNCSDPCRPTHICY
jgi:hypothetical protein